MQSKHNKCMLKFKENLHSFLQSLDTPVKYNFKKQYSIMEVRALCIKLCTCLFPHKNKTTTDLLNLIIAFIKCQKNYIFLYFFVCIFVL